MATGFNYQGFEEARAIARRRRLRILLPVAVVVTMLLALISIALVGYKTMRADALALSEGVITNLQSRIETEIASFLTPIPKVIQLTRDFLADAEMLSLDSDRTESLAQDLLRSSEQLSALFIGTPDGEFLMVRREPFGYSTKLIRINTQKPDQLEIVTSRYDATLIRKGRKIGPWDQYDPRKRLRAVVGADVTLSRISEFLASLEIGKTGVALLVDERGRVIAHPTDKLLLENADGGMRLIQVADLGDAAVSRAFDRFRVQGHGRRDFDLDGQRYISAALSLSHLLNRDWTVLLVVPENDFVGFVGDNVSKRLWMGLAILVLAALFAAFMVRQGLRTDRDALAIIERESRLDAEGEAFARLADQAQLFTDEEQSLAPVTEALVQATGVRRASIWQLTDSNNSLVCIDAFDQDTEGHTQGARLQQQDHQDAFKFLLQATESIHTTDASAEQSLSSLARHYLTPLGCKAMLCAPVRSQQTCKGFVWLEDGSSRQQWASHTGNFAEAIANLLAIRGSTAATSVTANQSTVLSTAQSATQSSTQQKRTPISAFAQHGVDTSLSQRRASAFHQRLQQSGKNNAANNTMVIDALAVAAIRFTDTSVLASRADADNEQTIMARLLDDIEQAASEHDIGYLKFHNDQMIAAIDPATDDDYGLQKLIEFSLTAKDQCERHLASQQSSLSFRIGIDIGPVVASNVGRDQHFTFWGEAAHTAARMADTGLPGSIQVTRPVYRSQQSRYLFQQRGHHYLEGVGEFDTYLLGGRL